jgi:Leucine-rich repeat (LRR) protein
VSAFPNLVELYASYNLISNLASLSFHERLEVLDIEANNVESLDDLIFNISTIETLSILNV